MVLASERAWSRLERQGAGGGACVFRANERACYGIGPRDPLTFVAAPAVFVAVALLAAYVPARRAPGLRVGRRAPNQACGQRLAGQGQLADPLLSLIYLRDRHPTTGVVRIEECLRLDGILH
jgi:hypothetical protein